MNEVEVLDHQCDGRSERFSVTEAGEDLHLIGLDLHPTAAPVTLLTPPKFVVDLCDVDLESRGQTFDDSHECLAV